VPSQNPCPHNYSLNKFTNRMNYDYMGETGSQNMAENENSLHNQDYDSPWKQIIEELLETFLEFFYPRLYADIDFTRG
jgi:hypothetical protein